MSEQSISITCPACSTVFSLPAGSIGEKGRILRCSVCRHRFLARPKSSPIVSPEPVAAEESPFNTEVPAEAQQPKTAATSDDPFSTSSTPTENATESSIEVDEPEETGTDAIEVGAHEELEQAGEVLESFLEVGDLGEKPAGETPRETISTGESPNSEDEGELPDFSGTGEDDGMVEFFVEDDNGQIERVETRANEEQESPATEETPPAAPTQHLTGEETIEMPAMDFSKSAPKEPEEKEAQPEDLIVPAAKSSTKESKTGKEPPIAQRWRNPGRGSKRAILASEQDAKPSSGMIYLIMLILIGLGGLATNFLDLGTWRFDPVWSVALIFFGVLGFSLQNLSGLYISGFFTLIYGFGLFSRQQTNLENGVFDGIWHLLVLFAIGFIFLLVYYILMNRKRGHFIVQEGQGQSVTALLLGIVAVLTGIFGHLVSSTIPNLGGLVFMSTPLQEIAYYSGVPLPVIIQSAVAACAVAFGFSAYRVRNRSVLFAALGILLGVVVFGMLYAQMVLGEIQIALPI